MTIAPSEKIFLPESREIPSILEEPVEMPSGGRRQKTRIASEADPGSSRSPEREPPFNRLGSKNLQSIEESMPPDSEITSNFNLGFPPGGNLDFSILPEEDMFQATKKNRIKRKINFSKYLYSDSGEALKDTTPLSSGTARTGKGMRRESGTRDYDITSWAQKVVAKIQNNWIIPPARESTPAVAVGISAVIKKNGELSSLRLVQPSNIHSLDQAALDALRLSLPLPHLPPDFPKENLEAYFLFQCHD